MKISATLGILLLGAVFGTAGAQETRAPVPDTASALTQDPIAAIQGIQREEQAAGRALAERRQEMIADCEENHGSEVDCRREADTELRAEGLQRGSGVIHLRAPR